MKSCPVGVFSVGLSAVFVYIFVMMMRDLFLYQSIDFTLQETMVSTSVSAEAKMFGIYFEGMDTTEFATKYQFYFNYFKNGSLVERGLMSPCSPQQWIQQGPDYNATFYSMSINGAFCPNFSKSYQLEGTLDQLNTSYISLSLQPCKRSDCDVQNVKDDLDSKASGSSFIKIWLNILDTGLYPEDLEPVNYNIIQDTRTTLSSGAYETAEVLFSSYRVETDDSFLPWEQNSVISGLQYDSITSSSDLYTLNDIKSTTKLTELKLGLNRKMRIYKRKVGKIDAVLSYVGGLFAIILGFVAFFLLSFSKYRYELAVAEGAFNFNEDGKKIKEHDFNLFTYVKYSIYTWVNSIFCTKAKWQSCNQIDTVREEVNYQMNINNVFLRLQTLEAGLNSKIEDNEQNCIPLFQPNCLDQVKQERLKLDYYQEVIKGEPATTLEDIIKDIETEKINPQVQGTGLQSSQNLMSALEISPNAQFVDEQQKKRTIDWDKVELNEKYLQAKLKAESVKISPQFNKIEKLLAQSYGKVKPQIRSVLELKIPVVILIRLQARLAEQEEDRIKVEKQKQS